MNLAPNFIGGREGRLAYLSGERCFNDENAVAAFQAVQDIAPYLPEGQEALTYYDSQQLFLLGEAAMWFGGSWDIPFFESEAPDFEWSVFAVPPPAGNDGHVTFHLDAGMGINAASQNKEEARLFLEWMATPEFAEFLGNELPGFFPIRNDPPQLANEHANAFLALNEGRGQDVRWAWPVLLDGAPDGYTLMQTAAIAVINGDMTPQEAADSLQEGLAEWFEPAQGCQ
jgi:raffinose/stachyose/melibiose transport system substrate-binding protein